MKRLLTAFLLTGSALSYGQVDYNPYVNLSSVNPSPLQPAEENGAGLATFHIGNSGTQDLIVPSTGTIMKVLISLSKGEPNNVAALNAVGGTFANRFSWLYDATSKTYQGTQILPISAGADGTITIAYKVTQNSVAALPQNGFNVNITPAAYMNGPNSTSDDQINKYVYTVTVISGNVFNDVNGMTDALVNGAGTNAGGLNAILINNANEVVAVVPVAADGTYAFTEAAAGTYEVLVSTANPAVGATAPAASVLPTNWVNTGEGLIAAGDGIVDGRVLVVKGVNSVTGVNFGIEQRPTANSATTASFTNPGSTNTITVPATSFSASDPSTGTVTSIIFTAFPNNVTSITVGGTTYTAGTFPPAGVTVAAPNGQPTQPVLIDPVDGGVVVNIPFQAIDNATYKSTNTGIVSVPFGVPLPLELLTFDASKQGTIAVLNWKTANETKVNAFEIERSVNGGAFAKLGTVAASNNSKGNYSFTDRTPGIGVDLYRLKMVDMDGKFTYSETRKLEFTDGKTDLVLFPNPATDELTVSFKAGNCSEVANAHVTIFDVAGRMVISKSWDDVCNNPSTIMNLRGLSDGAYYINVRNSGDNSVIMSKKFIKNK